jgi:hypothetical protein
MDALKFFHGWERDQRKFPSKKMIGVMLQDGQIATKRLKGSGNGCTRNLTSQSLSLTRSAMRTIKFKNADSRIAFQRGQFTANRNAADIVDQLRDQLAAAGAELTTVKYELAELRYRIAKRDREEAFANAPSPSTSLH